MGEALALLALLLFSTNVLVVKVATPRLGQDVGFLLALGSNVVFAALLFGAEQTVRSDPFVIEWDAFAAFAVGGLFTAYLGRRLFFRSVQTVGPSRASALQITNPVFAALIGWVLLGESLGAAAVVFVLLVIGGLYLTTQVATRTPAPMSAGSGPVPPGRASPRTALPRVEILLALGGALSYAVGNVIRSSAVRDWDQAVFGGLLGAACATVVYLVVHTDLRRLADRLRSAPRSGIWLWGLSGVLTISAQISLIASTRTIPVAVGVVVSAAIPLIVVPVSVVLFGNTEAVTSRTVTGIVLIFGGVAGLILT
ncbi:DMT family transporter [Pseudonocardia sp. H11422]|uniref:DMT family transporter n=1 Tax=Pseudonocardia sp. H11422 TaxID=2835866 RepID=UPI001BDD852E|nr:DMT family transporter [Pseudonocardia sp. H11422]